MNIRLPVIVLAALMPQLAFAVNKTTELRELRDNRLKWQQHNINSYEYRLRDEICYCLYGPYIGPVRVIIQNGRIAKAIYEGQIRDGYWPGRVVREKSDLIATVEEVFDQVERVIKSADQSHKIRYDREYGFPTLIDVDNPPGIADAQWRLVVDRFRPTK